MSHHENLNGLPSTAGHAVRDLTREIALAMKAIVLVGPPVRTSAGAGQILRIRS
jgi:hypothetical protein